MNALIRLVKGSPGKPLHPPLTDASIGGANVFVYGIRVLKRPDTPVSKALNPLGLPAEQSPPEPRAVPGERAP